MMRAFFTVVMMVIRCYDDVAQPSVMGFYSADRYTVCVESYGVTSIKPGFSIDLSDGFFYKCDKTIVLVLRKLE